MVGPNSKRCTPRLIHEGACDVCTELWAPGRDYRSRGGIRAAQVVATGAGRQRMGSPASTFGPKPQSCMPELHAIERYKWSRNSVRLP